MIVKFHIVLGFVIFFAIFIVFFLQVNNRNVFSRTAIIKTKILEEKPFEGVTKIVHQSWKTKDIPDFFRNYSRSWISHCFPDWKYKLWTDVDNLNLIKDYYPWFLNKYNELPANIYRVDISRYFYLFHFGGIYTDLDNECIRPFEGLLKNYSLVFGAMKGQFGGTSLKEGYVQNSFMYSRPKHPFWLEIIVDVFKSNSREIPEIVTGPVLLSNKIRDFIARPKTNSEIMVYPYDYFNPFSWIDPDNNHCKTRNKMSNEDYLNCKRSMIEKGAYVIQYHAHNWR